MTSVVPLLKHTPSAQDPRILEEITVQREPLIAKLVEVAADIDGGSRHQLLIGPRGIGKTHILTLVANRLREQAAGSVSLAWLTEDPWAIGSYEKFLAGILASIARERSDSQLTERADHLRANRDETGGEAEQALRDAAAGSRLVLLVENLDEIFRRIGANGQERFRAFLEDSPDVLLLATSPRLFEGVQAQASPFYGFFAITHLNELTLESATELMRRLAELRGNDELARFLTTDVAQRRLAAVEALAGGHPRIWLLLAGCISVDAIDELVPLFVEALDGLTPYYQDRLRELGDQQQEIVVLLSEAGGALSNRALAERSGIAQNQVANLLRQLAERGYVRAAKVPDAVATGDERISYWELREPLMRLCLDVKQARGKPLRMVVEFLRAWFGPRLLDELASLSPSAELATAYVSEAFKTLDGGLPLEALFRGSPTEIIARAELGLSLVPERSDLRLARGIGLFMEGRFADAKSTFEQIDLDRESDSIRLSVAALRTTSQLVLGEQVEVAGLVRELVELGREHPDAGATQAFVATNLWILDQYEQSLEFFPAAIAYEPESGVLLSSFADSLIEVGRHEEAVAAFEKLIALQPDQAAVLGRFAVALRTVGRLEDALGTVDRAIELDTKIPNLHWNRGMVLGLLGRDHDALPSFERAAELAPQDAALQASFGTALVRVGRLEEALQVFVKAVELKPGTAPFRERLGVLYLQLDDPAKALPQLEAAAELDPEKMRIHNNVGVALSELGRYEEALAVYDRAAELDPDDTDVKHNLGMALWELDRFDRAVPLLAEAFAANPDDLVLATHLGGALVGVRRYDDALEVFRRAVELAPEHAGAHGNLGRALRLLDRHEEALEVFAKGIELDSGNAMLYEDSGLSLREIDRPTEAIDAFRHAIDADPQTARNYDHLADVLFELGRYDEAQAMARAAVELEPDDVVARFTLAEAVFMEGDWDEGLRQLQSALAVWRKDREGPAGQPELLCRLLWDEVRSGPERRALIERTIALYNEVRAGEELGRGLVGSVAWFAAPTVSDEVARTWVDDWAAARHSEDLEIPLQLLSAALNWKVDRDRAHLLELPSEQRQILTGLLEAAEADPGE